MNGRSEPGGSSSDGVDGPVIEWLDIVDERNRVVGRAPRDVIHREGHLHRSVHMLLLDGAGRVFVQRRGFGKDSNPGLWDSSAAGHVDSGEGVLEAAVRELHEELGVRVPPEALLRTGGLPPTAETGFEFVEIYRVVSDAPLTLEAEEIAEGRWLGVTELERWMADRPADFTDSFHLVWRSARPAAEPPSR